MICTSPTVRLVNYCFTTRTSRTNRTGRAKRNMPLYGSYQFVYIGQPSTSRERKLTKTLFIVTLASLTLTQPFNIFWILDTVSSHTFKVISNQTWFRIYYCFGFVFFANSLDNPICFGFRIPEFRRALLSCRCRFLPQPAQVFPLNN